MVNSGFPMPPDVATRLLLNKLPSRRMKDILAKRFGLMGGKRKTLESIGKEYKITRERVRQIEADAVAFLSRPENHEDVAPLLAYLEQYISGHGGVVAEHFMFSKLVGSKEVPHISFLLEIGKSFMRVPESSHFHNRWTTDKKRSDAVEAVLMNAREEIARQKEPMGYPELRTMLVSSSKSILGEDLSDEICLSYLGTCKVIKQNPYDEFGLVDWPTITPRGVKDKAYLVLAKNSKPMHFRDVAEGINRLGWSKKKAHPQTVHNELIKDPRFVLVGRGLYALKNWGYETGTVRDILVSVLKSASRPLTKDEIIERVLAKRFVKAPTVLLNLQNKSLFRKVDDGRYSLVA